MSRGPDAGTLLRRALARDALASGISLSFGEAESSRWASATFVGARHSVKLTIRDDAAAEAWLGGLRDVDLPMRGHFVADVVVQSVARDAGEAKVVIEALTVES